METLEHKKNHERGFTLVELLVVIVILGVLAAVAAVAVTRFIGRGTLESANAELKQARTAIHSCMAVAETGQIDGGVPVEWSGGWGVVTAGGGGSDAAQFLKGGEYFKATYVVSPEGSITGVTTQEWSDITWVDDHWE